MVSFLLWCQAQFIGWQPSPILAGILFILMWVGLIVAGIALGIGLSDEEGGYKIR